MKKERIYTLFETLSFQKWRIRFLWISKTGIRKFNAHRAKSFITKRHLTRVTVFEAVKYVTR